MNLVANEATPQMELMRMLMEAFRCYQAGRLEDSQQIFRQILAVDGDNAESLHLLGVISHETGKQKDAIELIGKAIALCPNQDRYHSNLGNALKASGLREEAMAQYRRAVALNPNFAQGHYNLGVCFLEDGQMAECVVCFERSIVLQPEFAAAHSNLGVAYQAQGRLDEAVDAYRRALALKPDYVRAHHNLGNTYIEQNRVENAIACYDRALAARPDFAESAYSKGLAQLVQEDFAAGWTNYERRWETQYHQRRPEFRQPIWRGDRLREGRLLIWSEQGIGDAVMFAGLIPDAIRSGNRCVLDCKPRLRSLFARSFPVEVVAGFEGEDVAAQIPLGSLPSLFRRSAADFKATTTPYLKADKLQRDEFRARYKRDGRVIGLAWHTKDIRTGFRRSLELAAFSSLFAVRGNSWVSLQYGDLEELLGKARAAKAPIWVDESVDQLRDLDRFAAQVAAMDLVITIDNSTAHMAGALGVPVWLLLPFAPDWRWFLQREDSPWYPTMRIFRQPAPGDWHSVLKRVAEALAEA